MRRIALIVAVVRCRPHSGYRTRFELFTLPAADDVAYGFPGKRTEDTGLLSSYNLAVGSFPHAERCIRAVATGSEPAVWHMFESQIDPEALS